MFRSGVDISSGHAAGKRGCRKESFPPGWKYLCIPLLMCTYIVSLTRHRYWCCHVAGDQVMNGEMEWYRNKDAAPDTD